MTAVSCLSIRTPGAGESRFASSVAPALVFSAFSAIVIMLAIRSARFRRYLGVFRAMEWTMPTAHSLESPIVAPTEMLASTRARKASGVLREKRGSREGGDHGFLKR